MGTFIIILLLLCVLSELSDVKRDVNLGLIYKRLDI